MNKVILIFSVLVSIYLPLSAQAFSFSSQISVSAAGELTKTLNLQCSPKDTLCLKTCDNAYLCQIPETFCEDCATASSAILHTVFTDLTRVFKSELIAIDQNQISQFLKTQKFMTLSHDSFLNLFTPENKQEIKAQFESLCYTKNVQTSLLLTTLNEQNQIDQLVGIICQDQKGQSVILPMQFNPLFSKKRIEYWSLPTEAPLKLKFSDDVSLP